MTPQSSCKYNGHGFNDDGVCIYCHEDDGTQTTASDEVQDLTTELEHARDEIDSFEDRYDEGYQEGYDKALENAINAVEGLQ